MSDTGSLMSMLRLVSALYQGDEWVEGRAEEEGPGVPSGHPLRHALCAAAALALINALGSINLAARISVALPSFALAANLAKQQDGILSLQQNELHRRPLSLANLGTCGPQATCRLSADILTVQRTRHRNSQLPRELGLKEGQQPVIDRREVRFDAQRPPITPTVHD